MRMRMRIARGVVDGIGDLSEPAQNSQRVLRRRLLEVGAHSGKALNEEASRTLDVIPRRAHGAIALSVAPSLASIRARRSLETDRTVRLPFTTSKP